MLAWVDWRSARCPLPRLGQQRSSGTIRFAFGWGGGRVTKEKTPVYGCLVSRLLLLSKENSTRLLGDRHERWIRVFPNLAASSVIAPQQPAVTISLDLPRYGSQIMSGVAELSTALTDAVVLLWIGPSRVVSLADARETHKDQLCDHGGPKAFPRACAGSRSVIMRFHGNTRACGITTVLLGLYESRHEYATYSQ